MAQEAAPTQPTSTQTAPVQRAADAAAQMDAAGEKVTVSAVRTRAGVSMDAARQGVEQYRTTGWVKYGARWYNPTTGRWTQQDTLDTPWTPPTPTATPTPPTTPSTTPTPQDRTGSTAHSESVEL